MKIKFQFKTKEICLIYWQQYTNEHATNKIEISYLEISIKARKCEFWYSPYMFSSELDLQAWIFYHELVIETWNLKRGKHAARRKPITNNNLSKPEIDEYWFFFMDYLFKRFQLIDFPQRFGEIEIWVLGFKGEIGYSFFLVSPFFQFTVLTNF